MSIDVREGAFFVVGVDENGDGFAERFEGEFDARAAASMLAALIGQLMHSDIDPLVFQSTVVGILANAGTDNPEGDDEGADFTDEEFADVQP